MLPVRRAGRGRPSADLTSNLSHGGIVRGITADVPRDRPVRDVRVGAILTWGGPAGRSRVRAWSRVLYDDDRGGPLAEGGARVLRADRGAVVRTCLGPTARARHVDPLVRAGTPAGRVPRCPRRTPKRLAGRGTRCRKAT